MTDAALTTLADVRAALAQGDASAESLTRAALASIEAENPTLRAFVTLDGARALEDARHSDTLRRLGRDAGPLAGAPIGVKDIIDVAGLRTQGGSLTRDTAEAAVQDAPVVTRLRAAGAVIIGKTHTVEYAFGGWGSNVSLGTPLNPRDRAHPRVPGGSSSGSGVAVAAGLVVGALGTDTGGSIRLPASFCGVVGLKTTPGLIDKTGVLPLTPMLDTIGPMTNCVADAAALLAILAPAQDAVAPGWSARLSALAANRPAGVAGLRVGVIANLGAPVHDDTARVFKQTCAQLEQLGAHVDAFQLPCSLVELAQPCGELLAIDGYRFYGPLAEARPSRIGAPVRARMLSGRAISASRLMTIFDDRAARRLEFAELFARYDVLMSPTTPFPAPLMSEFDENASPGLFTRFVNYLDLAALSLPMGATPGGLPIGVQIVVPGLHEPMALRVGAALEAARGALRLGR